METQKETQVTWRKRRKKECANGSFRPQLGFWSCDFVSGHPGKPRIKITLSAGKHGLGGRAGINRLIKKKKKKSVTGHDNRRNGRCKCATVTSPDVQQSRQKTDPTQGWRDRPDTFKAPFANAHVNGITTQKEQPRKNFPPWWFFHILSAQGTAAMSSAGSTQRGTKAEGWDGLNSSNEISRRASHLCPLW